MYNEPILEKLEVPKDYMGLLNLCKSRYNNLTGLETPYISFTEMRILYYRPPFFTDAKSCIDYCCYKRNYSFVIKRKAKECIDFFIPAIVLYGMIMFQKEVKINAKSLKKSFHKEFGDLDENFIFRFSLKHDYPKVNGIKVNEFFLTENDFGLKDLNNTSPEISYTKYYFKPLINI